VGVTLDGGENAKGVVIMPTQLLSRAPHSPSESLEPYVSAERAAHYLDIKRKTLLEKARKGQIPAYPWGDGMRRTWRFKISQLDEWMKSRIHSGRRPPLS
jgi:excisionase family DNA binding protein